MLKYTKIVDLLAVQTSSGLGIFRVIFWVKIQIVDKKLNFKNCFWVNFRKNVDLQFFVTVFTVFTVFKKF